MLIQPRLASILKIFSSCRIEISSQKKKITRQENEKKEETRFYRICSKRKWICSSDNNIKYQEISHMKPKCKIFISHYL